MAKDKKQTRKRLHSKSPHPPHKSKKHKSEHSKKPKERKASSSIKNKDKPKEETIKMSSKIEKKIAHKKDAKLNLDPKLKNKNHQQKAKNWKDLSGKPSKGSDEEQRSILRKTYNKMMENSKDKTKAQELVENCITLMGTQLGTYAFKRDGSVIIQACIKNGSKDQIERIKQVYKDNFYKLMEDKYGRYLAKKLYEETFNEKERKAVFVNICENMEKYMMHMYAADLIEHIYIKGNGEAKKKIFEASFGTKLKIIKATEDIPKDDIEKIFEEHPIIKDQLMIKLAKQIDMFVSKGLIRLNFVQRIVLFYVKNAPEEGIEKILEEEIGRAHV